MQRRGFIKSAALASTAMATGFGGLSYLSRPATAAGSNRLGVWTSGLGQPMLRWPLIPIHAVLLGDGRLLTYGTNVPNQPPGQQTGKFYYDIWDPSRGVGPESHFTMDNTTGTDIFCSAQLVLPQNGSVFLAGGDNWDTARLNTTNTGNNNTNIFNPGNNGLARSNPMNAARWYASTTTLPDGRIYIQGGTSGGEAHPEMRQTNGAFTLLNSINTSSLNALYPRNRVTPTGRIFGYSDLDMYYVDLDGTPRITMAGRMPADGPSGWTSTDVLYAPGKIMRTGGGSNALPEQGGSTVAAKNAAAVIDINGPTPVYKKMPSMPLSLHWANGTVMADGNVVVTGGSQVENSMTGLNTTALLWKADTGSWTQGARSTPNIPRLYHSVALLLPDGTIFSGGGGAPGPYLGLDAEIFYPPYLFTNSGAPAPRPTITSAPATVRYGDNFFVGVDPASGIQRVTFIKTASVTHSVNFEQCFMQLSFSASSGGIRVQAPSSANLATPGNYLLFVFNSQGVPSIAKIIGIG
jgi:hypothetical protein